MFSDFKVKTDLERVGYKLKEKDLSLPDHEQIQDEAYTNIQTFVRLFYSNEEAVKALILTPMIVYNSMEGIVCYMKNILKSMMI